LKTLKIVGAGIVAAAAAAAAAVAAAASWWSRGVSFSVRKQQQDLLMSSIHKISTQKHDHNP
jgi:hypothetical protein